MRSCGIASENKGTWSLVAIRRFAMQRVPYGEITLVHILEETNEIVIIESSVLRCTVVVMRVRPKGTIIATFACSPIEQKYT